MSLAELIRNALGERSIPQVAAICDVPYWVLRDVLSGQTTCPRPAHLRGISKGLNIPLDTLLAAAYREPAVVTDREG